MLPHLTAAKFGVQIVSGIGITKIIDGVIKNNVPIVSTFDAVTVWTAKLVLGSLLFEQTANHIEKMATDASGWMEKKKDEEETKV